MVPDNKYCPQKGICNCSNLSTITLHDNIENIYEKAFGYSSLYTLKVKGYENEEKDY